MGDLAAGEAVQRWPHVLPGGTAILYSGSNVAGSFKAPKLMIQPLPSGTPRQLDIAGFHGHDVKSGHILYIHEGAMWAVPFDLATLKVTGPSAQVLEDVSASEGRGGAQYSVSDAGTLVYSPRHGDGPSRKREH